MNVKTILTAEDWIFVVREDGSIFLTCGDLSKSYHAAFDIAIEDIDLANRICQALNEYNKGVYA